MSGTKQQQTEQLTDAAPDAANLPATVENGTDVELAKPGGVLALASDDPWASVDTGFVGDRAHSEASPIIPRLMFNANKGYGFVDELTSDVVGEGSAITCSWLAWSESRAYWAEEFGTKGDKQPDCRSLSMIVPDEGVPNRQSDTCASCPHSKWTRGDDGDEGPTCGVRVNVLLWLIAVDGDTSVGGRITRTAFRGIAVKHVRRYLGFFASKGVKLPPMSRVTTIKVVPEATDFGDKLVPSFHIGEAVPYDEAQPLITAREDFLAEWRSALADDLARPEAGGENVPPATVDAASTESGTAQYAEDEEPF